jgi:hypothetical protein
MDLAFTTKTIIIPDIEIKSIQTNHKYVPLRGHGYVMAVYDNHKNCIGWVDVKTLGYETVKDWMSKTNWIDEGF